MLLLAKPLGLLAKPLGLLAQPLAQLAPPLGLLGEVLASVRELAGQRVPLRQLLHPVGLQPREERVAVPRLDDRRDRVCPWRVLVPENTESKERRHDHQAKV